MIYASMFEHAAVHSQQASHDKLRGYLIYHLSVLKYIFLFPIISFFFLSFILSFVIYLCIIISSSSSSSRSSILSLLS